MPGGTPTLTGLSQEEERAKTAKKEYQGDRRNTREVWHQESRERNGLRRRKQTTVLNPEKSR